MTNDFFPYGVQYYRQPTPLPDEWASDLKKIKEAGYSHIQLRPQWRWAEKQEGEYYLDDVLTLMDLAQENNLRVIMKPFVECAPDWIFTKYNGKMVGYNGVTIDPIAFGAWYVGGWGPCFDNPYVMEKGQGFVKALTKAVKDHPALWFYNAWNEAACIHTEQCCCEYSKQSYRNWLRDKFKTIDNLNNFFGKAWTDFDYIEPNPGLGDYVDIMLFKDWAGWAVAQHVHGIYEAIKSEDPNKDVMCHAGPNQINGEPITGAKDDILDAKAVDFFGTSYNCPSEPKTFEQKSEGIQIGDWIRCCDKNFWVQEIYPSELAWGKTPREDLLRMTIWQALMSGCKGITFWQFKKERLGSESFGWGMRGLEGENTPEGEICDDIGAKIKAHEDIIAKSQAKQAVIGHIFHKQQHLLSSLAGTWNWRQTDRPLNFNNRYQTALKNNHIIFGSRPLGGADYLTWDSDFEGYKVITLADDEIISSEMAKKLKKYVFEGGNLIVEYPFACRDLNTWVSKKRPNNGLEEMLGFKEIRRSNDTEHFAIYGGDGEIFAKLKGFPWYIDVEIVDENCEVLGTWDSGKPAFVKHKYGSGCVYSLIASPSLVYNEENATSCSKISSYILKDLGVKITDFGTLSKVRFGENADIVFLTNDTPNDMDFVANCSEIIDTFKGKYENGRIKLPKGGFIVYIRPKN